MSNNSSNVEVSDETITQGRVFLRAIEALEAIVPGGQTESRLAKQLAGVYRYRLRESLRVAPARMISEEILGADG